VPAVLGHGDRESRPVVVRRMQRADHAGPGMTCLVCAFRDELRVTPIEARILVAMYRADPDAWTPARDLDAVLGYAPAARTHTGHESHLAHPTKLRRGGG